MLVQYNTNVQCSLCLWYMYFVGEQTFSYCCLLTAYCYMHAFYDLCR